MRRVLPLVFLALVTVPGCGVLSLLLGLGNGNETGSSQLKAFSSEKELVDFFTGQLAATNSRGPGFGFGFGFGAPAEDLLALEGAPPALTAPGPATTDANGAAGDGATGGFSQTILQEVGVDEADIVKTDGANVYVIRNDGGRSVLTIARVSPPESLATLGEVPLEGFGREIYLHNDKVVALSETSGGFFIQVADFGPVDTLVAPADSTTTPDIPPMMDGGMAMGGVEVAAIDPAFPPGDTRFERPRTVVTVIDVADPQNPIVLSSTKFDGVGSASRLVDGVLHLVVSNFQDFFFDVFPRMGDPMFDPRVVEASDILPDFERTDADGTTGTGAILAPSELYHPVDPDGFGVVSLISVDIDNDAAFQAVGVMANPGLIYASQNAMYLTDTQYDFSGATRETTDLYKFAFVDRGTVPVATGSVPGRVLNQYSMGEYKGFLRVATTIGPTFSIFGQRTESKNNVYVLEQDGDALTIVGGVGNIAPRETIQSARFVGNRGYVVTFEQIDPLFTLDLSDPTDPRVLGELKVPGFSTFLHPIDEDHLLAVGRYIPEEGFFPWGVQLSIFDVSDFANPRQTANVVLGMDSGASSEALFNPKALAYFPQRGLVGLPLSIDNAIPLPFEEGGGVILPAQSLPVDVTVDPISPDAPPPDSTNIFPSPFDPQGFEGLAVFRVDVADGIEELGRVDMRFPEAGIYWSSFTRGVFIEDDVFAITDHGIRGAPVGDLSQPAYELLFEP